uniref:Chromosome 6 open reading frame 58 n=1 Tax=Loxodonta africana TaxID=9785 RepID=G3T1M5_LOXAF
MAFLPSWTCVIVGCLSASLAVTSNLSDLYPPLWEEGPSQFSDYRMKDGQYIINAWVYPERMGMYKILLTQTARYFERFAPENEQNTLWRLPLQHGWQCSTLFFITIVFQYIQGTQYNNKKCPLTFSSACGLNYFLCVLPFLAVVDSGVMGISSHQVTLLSPPRDQYLFCFNVSTCRSSFLETMNKWNAFYQHLKLPSSTFEDLLKYLWAAHTSVLTDTLKTFESRIKLKNCFMKRGQKFKEGKRDEIFGYCASDFPTTLIRTHDFQKGLSPWMLVTGDTAPFISDFTDFGNKIL